MASKDICNRLQLQVGIKIYIILLSFMVKQLLFIKVKNM
jgi:hypothetical protein